MDKLAEIIKACKCEVSLDVNSHTMNYCSVEQELLCYTDIDEVGKECWNKMIEKDTMYQLTCFINTPLGSVCFYSDELEGVINKAYNGFKEENLI